jgi:membrane-associated phospholipid phosphatase
MEYNPTPAAALTRRQELGLRLRTRWLAKLTGVTAGMTAFFVVYFRLLNHPLFPVTVMPAIAIDRLVGFRPEALPLYLSLWLYVPLAPALLKTRRELVAYAAAAVALSAIGFAVFLVWPTAVPRPAIDWSRHPAFAFLKTVDASGNACPSLHAAFAVFTAIWLDRPLRALGAGVPVRMLSGLWCLGIVASTVATRQHVALDALAGMALGAVVAAWPGGRGKSIPVLPSRGSADTVRPS